MPEQIAGVLLSAEEATYALAVLDYLLRGQRPSPRLQSFISKLAKSASDAGVSGPSAGADARVIAQQGDSGQLGRYDLLDSTEAAKILGCSPNGIRDLCRRGSLPSFRVGGRWLLPAAGVVQRAERQAARRR